MVGNTAQPRLGYSSFSSSQSGARLPDSRAEPSAHCTSALAVAKKTAHDDLTLRLRYGLAGCEVPMARQENDGWQDAGFPGLLLIQAVLDSRVSAT
jgi:hypothetical protein